MNSDLKLKILSLLLAIVVWFHAVTEKVYISHASLQIEYKLPPKTYIINSPPKECELLVRGKGKMLILFNLHKHRVTVDLSKYRPGKRVVKVPIPNYREVEIVSCMPQKVAVELDKMATKKVNVIPVVVGAPAEGYSVAEVRVDPPKVKLIGPSKLIRNIKNVLTQDVDIDGTIQSFGKRVKVIVPQDTTGLITPDPPDVNVMVTLEETEIDSVLIPIAVRSSRWSSFKLEPSEVTLFYRVPKSLKTHIKSTQFHAWVEVDTTADRGDKLELPVNSKGPKDVKIVGTNPSNVKVFIRR